MWNPFKKNTNNGDDTQKMGMLGRIAIRKLEKMNPKEREKMMQDAFKPENKDKMLAVMDQMRASGQITEEQYNQAKQRLGL